MRCGEGDWDERERRLWRVNRDAGACYISGRSLPSAPFASREAMVSMLYGGVANSVRGWSSVVRDLADAKKARRELPTKLWKIPILRDANVSRTPLLTRLFTHLHRSDAWTGHH